MTTAFDIVRVQTLEDCRPVRPLVEAHARFERSSIVVPTDWAERVARFVVTGELELFVAHRAGVPVGYASSTVIAETWSGETFADLDCLFVDEQWRGAGIGTLLMQAVSAQALEDGCAELQWQTPSWNADAIGFYERIGARHTNKERFVLALSAHATGSRVPLRDSRPDSGPTTA